MAHRSNVPLQVFSGETTPILRAGSPNTTEALLAKRIRNTFLQCNQAREFFISYHQSRPFFLFFILMNMLTKIATPKITKSGVQPSIVSPPLGCVLDSKTLDSLAKVRDKDHNPNNGNHDQEKSPISQKVNEGLPPFSFFPLVFLTRTCSLFLFDCCFHTCSFPHELHGPIRLTIFTLPREDPYQCQPPSPFWRCIH
jgi:hypothetical protein